MYITGTRLVRSIYKITGNIAHRNITIGSTIARNKTILLLTLSLPPCCIAAGCSPANRFQAKRLPISATTYKRFKYEYTYPSSYE